MNEHDNTRIACKILISKHKAREYFIKLKPKTMPLPIFGFMSSCMVCRNKKLMKDYEDMLKAFESYEKRVKELSTEGA